MSDWMPEVGLFSDIPEDDYRAAPGLSASEAKVLLGKRPPAPSPALAFGTLVHALVLEPHRESEFLTLDAAAIAGTNPKTGRAYDNPTMTSRFKSAVAEAEQSGKTVVAQTDWDAALAMRDAVHAHKHARYLLTTCTRREISGWAMHGNTMVKGRIDLLGPGIVADLKTTRDGNPDTFGFTCRDFMYHVSAANYVDICRAAGEFADAVLFINCEKEPPWRVSVVELDADAIADGRALMAEAVARYEALGHVELPSYGDGIHVVSVPTKSDKFKPEFYELETA